MNLASILNSKTLTLAFAVMALSYLATGIAGLAVAAGAAALALVSEFARVISSAKFHRRSKLWPQVFDSCHSAAIAGLSQSEMLSDLTVTGPQEFRTEFRSLAHAIHAVGAAEALAEFQRANASPQADLFVMLLALDGELGNRGQREAWRQAASGLRQRLKLAGEVQAKQGWLVGSAKLAVLAPWLVALMLMQLGNNREIFASPLGSLVLLGGLALSVFGYFLVGWLGRLPQQPRVLYAS